MWQIKVLGQDTREEVALWLLEVTSAVVKFTTDRRSAMKFTAADEVLAVMSMPVLKLFLLKPVGVEEANGNGAHGESP